MYKLAYYVTIKLFIDTNMHALAPRQYPFKQKQLYPKINQLTWHQFNLQSFDHKKMCQIHISLGCNLVNFMHNYQYGGYKVP